jgi:DNA repair photolyase
MVKEIQARVILNAVKQPDTWFGLRYNMNLYRGCQHQCIYCDSRSECYQIEDFAEILVKSNALDLLEKELSRKRIKGSIGFGSMNDPYMPVEATYNLTGQALAIIARYHFPVHILTKSDLVLRDIPVLQQIARVYAAVTLTITTAADRLAKLVEPGAPPSSRRFQAIRTLNENGILSGVAMMPVLPFIEDNEENITAIVEQAHAAGAAYILPAFGLSCRDRQRAYY